MKLAAAQIPQGEAVNSQWLEAVLFPVATILTCASNFLYGLMSDSCSMLKSSLCWYNGFQWFLCLKVYPVPMNYEAEL